MEFILGCAYVASCLFTLIILYYGMIFDMNRFNKYLILFSILLALMFVSLLTWIISIAINQAFFNSVVIDVILGLGGLMMVDMYSYWVGRMFKWKKKK